MGLAWEREARFIINVSENRRLSKYEATSCQLWILSMYHTLEMLGQLVLMCFKYSCLTVLNTLSLLLRIIWNWVFKSYYINYIIASDFLFKIVTLFLNITIWANLTSSSLGIITGWSLHLLSISLPFLKQSNVIQMSN